MPNLPSYFVFYECDNFPVIDHQSWRKINEGCAYPITHLSSSFCWISASPFRCVISLSLSFSYTVIILLQDAIVVQFNILQCISNPGGGGGTQP